MSEEIKNMFSKISKHYDYMNNVMSLGMHHLWRKRLVKLSGAKTGDSILDTASGTGDLAIEFKKTVKEGRVLATDFCSDMLKHLPMKAIKKNVEIDAELADILNLHFEKNAFDIVGISFGIRNVDDLYRALAELARVTKPGGKLMILETGKPKGFLKRLYDYYSNKIMPKLGKMLIDEEVAYTYLPKTIGSFPYGQKFVDILLSTDRFTEVKCYPQFFGVAYIYACTVK
ncbi:ubiquinone/menaquinone biosynthesis methyltransferase [bacterium]|nr:MAG: ubiquinone/menaquinone biosynthesis methyltransferase [bacterium]